MIIPDINLLLYAYNSDLPQHKRAKEWWAGLLNGVETVGIPWVVSLGFVRLSTSPGVFQLPLEGKQALSVVMSWLEVNNVQPLEPGPRHLEIAYRLVAQCAVAGTLTTDIHLAALAIEFGCELHSNDRDFARFSGIKWVNPLE